MLSLFQDLSSFLSLLQSRQNSLHPGDGGAMHKGVPSSLNYANALLRHQEQRLGACPLPAQVAVIGPTQSGKSSLVNLILGASAADASPLAGYTRHPQGFCNVELTDRGEDCLDQMLSNWRRVGKEEEPGSDSEVFSLERIDGGGAFTTSDVLVWDTPDFDSVSSREYRETVPQICAIADVIVMVVCREKYSDRSVWEMLRLVSTVDIPLLICLNKTGPGEQSTLQSSLQQRLREASVSCAGIFCLPFVPTAGERLGETAEADSLRTRLAGLLPGLPVARPAGVIYRFLASHWADWTSGVQLEISAAERWSAMVGSGLKDSVAIYKRDYLDNPAFSDTLQRAVFQLLQLLEIPGIAPVVTRMRSVLTWPARKLQEMLGSRWGRGGAAEPGKQEGRILEDAVSHLLVTLRQQANRQMPPEEDAGYPWWRGLLRLLEQRESDIRGLTRLAVADYQAGFEREIEAAGRRLYKHLQAHPAALNSLRAARATTDAAGVVLAVKTGGIGVNDLILTPAMLSITSLLAQGAVGQYMKQIAKELRERQLELVQQNVFEAVLRKQLLELPLDISDNQCLRIPRELVERAAGALPRLRGAAREAVNG